MMFPTQPFLIRHTRCGDPRLDLPALIALARELPEDRVEYNLGDLAINQDPASTPSNRLSAVETLLRIGECRSWMALKNIEHSAPYALLMRETLAELTPHIPGVTPRNLEGFVFVSSPGSVTPFHNDPEHNFLLQVRGSKTVHIFDPHDSVVFPDDRREASCFGAHRNLPWRDEFAGRGQSFTLHPGDALHFPVRAPHWVQNGPDVSISYSFTFRSELSENERKRLFVNALVRRAGLAPSPDGRWKVPAYDALMVPLGLAKRSRRLRALLLRHAG